jgi:hypothetical protein
MKTLKNLKNRLEILPEIRKGIKQRGFFDEYLSKVTGAKEQLISASMGVTYASPVLPSPKYAAALQLIKKSSRIAKNLAEKIRDDADTISDRGTEESFIKTIEYAKEASKEAKLGWQSSVQAKIDKWEIIAGVVAIIAKENHGISEHAEKLKSSVNALRNAKDVLPSSMEETARLQMHLADLTDAISKLGLDTPFGKFLQNSATEHGALLSDAEEESVVRQIKSLGLSSVFRVRLTS